MRPRSGVRRSPAERKKGQGSRFFRRSSSVEPASFVDPTLSSLGGTGFLAIWQRTHSMGSDAVNGSAPVRCRRFRLLPGLPPWRSRIFWLLYLHLPSHSAS
jgi:hypothetical protein